MEKFQEATMGYGGYGHYAKKDGHIYGMVIFLSVYLYHRKS